MPQIIRGDGPEGKTGNQLWILFVACNFRKNRRTFLKTYFYLGAPSVKLVNGFDRFHDALQRIVAFPFRGVGHRKGNACIAKEKHGNRSFSSRLTLSPRPSVPRLFERHPTVTSQRKIDVDQRLTRIQRRYHKAINDTGDSSPFITIGIFVL